MFLQYKFNMILNSGWRHFSLLGGNKTTKFWVSTYLKLQLVLLWVQCYMVCWLPKALHSATWSNLVLQTVTVYIRADGGASCKMTAWWSAICWRLVQINHHRDMLHQKKMGLGSGFALISCQHIVSRRQWGHYLPIFLAAFNLFMFVWETFALGCALAKILQW